MKLYRFSPIKNEAEMVKAIAHIHVSCHVLCKQILGTYLQVAGNIGVFCHYDEEYELLTDIRNKLTDASDNWNRKYYRLFAPITIPVKGDIPAATYSYLYIRKPDIRHPQVGDLDFYMEPRLFIALKQSLREGRKIKGASILNRPDLDLVQLADPAIDAVGFVGGKTMVENVKEKKGN